jgi:hypothetical protein
MGIDCSNEDHGPAVCFHVGRMRWRSAETADKMRRGLGGLIKSVHYTSSRGGGDGNGPEQPLLRKLTAKTSLGDKQKLRDRNLLLFDSLRLTKPF